MYFKFKTPESISDLKWVPSSVGALREKIDIAIIDDEVFEPSENLKNRRFRLFEIGDPADVKVIEQYPIVLCDIRGVGTHFGSSLEGSHLIKTIKRFYPFKYVIAYTGQGLDKLHNANIQFAEKYISKDADIDQWEEALESAILSVSDPRMIWRITRKHLLEKDVTLLRLVELEDSFVRSIKNKEDMISNKIQTLELSEDIKKVMLSFIATAFTKLLEIK